MTFREWLEAYPLQLVDKYDGTHDIALAAADLRADAYVGCLPDDATDLGCILLHVVTAHKPIEAAVKAFCAAELEYRTLQEANNG